MPNPYFQFKQFTIQQDKCAMKVCTDACTLGAWFAAKVPHSSTILDIGSGTGLLMMMMAQKCESEIHGIEIDLSSFRQSKENISQNKWRERLKVVPGDIRSYTFPQKYDFIISNPPFFENDLRSQAEEEQVAKHSKQLTFEELLQSIDNNLQPYGALGILLPYQRWEHFDSIASRNNLFLTEKLFVKQTPGKDYFRAILHYSRSKQNFVPGFELTIQQQDNTYSEDFTELMKDYYLYL